MSPKYLIGVTTVPMFLLYPLYARERLITSHPYFFSSFKVLLSSNFKKVQLQWKNLKWTTISFIPELNLIRSCSTKISFPLTPITEQVPRLRFCTREKTIWEDSSLSYLRLVSVIIFMNRLLIFVERSQVVLGSRFGW